MNPWIAHVKAVAADKGISYTQALKVASSTYEKRNKSSAGKKKKTKATTPIEGGQVADQVADQVGNAVETAAAASGIKTAIKDYNVQVSSFGLIRNIVNLIKVVATKDSTSAEKIAAGRTAFIGFVIVSVSAIFAAYGLLNPLTSALINWLTPIVAGKLYDFIVRKIKERKTGGMAGGIVVDELPYHPNILTNITETYFYFLDKELDKFM